MVEDGPAVFFYEDKEYIPQNYEDKYFGYVTLRTALAHSLNVATVKVAEMVGCPDALYFSRLFRRRYGKSPREFRHGAERGSSPK